MNERSMLSEVERIIAKFLKQLRENQGISIEELSAKTHWNIEKIRQAETSGEIGLPELDQLAKIYGISRKEILNALDNYLDKYKNTSES